MGESGKEVNEGQPLPCCFHLCLLLDTLVRNCNSQSVNTANQHADVTGVQPCKTPWKSPSDFCGFSPPSSSPSECDSDQGKSPPSSKNLHFLYKMEGKASLHSKWVHPVITSFVHCTCQVLVQAPVLTYLDCCFQFLEEMWDAMFICRKRIHYHVSVTWIMVPQPFILHSHKNTILVVKIIVIFQKSAHHYLQTTFKDAKSVMLSYFLFITCHFSTLHYSIQRYFLFSLLTFH